MLLENKVAIITGAASGIGMEIAALFVREGARVTIADQDQERANAVADDLGGHEHAIGIAVDVTNEAAVDACVAKTVAAFGKVDILVSNAGIQTVAPLHEFEFDRWKQLLAVHLDGAFLTRGQELKGRRQHTDGSRRNPSCDALRWRRRRPENGPGHGERPLSKRERTGPFDQQICRVRQFRNQELFPPDFLAEVIDRWERGADKAFADVVVAGKPIVPQIESWASSQGIELPEGWKVDVARLAKKRALSRGADKFDKEFVDRWTALFNDFQAMEAE